MRILIVFSSALALSGSMAVAMQDEAMDEEMLMEAPAPSVAVGGSGKIGVKSVDDSSKPDVGQFQLIRAYKVTFDSKGTTDGGLMFGAGMSIRDDTGEEDEPVVKDSYVFVGGADGSWKLQFGGNDPGIDLAGGFGVADDHFGGGDDTTIALSGSFGDTLYRITAADPGNGKIARVFDNTATPDVNESNFKAYQAAKIADNDWSIGVSHLINTINVGFGMDSEGGLAIGLSTSISGVTTSFYWSKSDHADVIVAEDPDPTCPDKIASQENMGLGVMASMSTGEGTTFSVGYSTLKLEQSGADGEGNNGTTKTKLIEVDFSYDLGGGAIFSAGIDKKDAETLTSADSGNDAILGTKDITMLEAVIAFSF